MKYTHDRSPTISGLRRVSKPGRRVYAKIKELPRVYNGLGISILSKELKPWGRTPMRGTMSPFLVVTSMPSTRTFPDVGVRIVSMISIRLSAGSRTCAAGSPLSR